MTTNPSLPESSAVSASGRVLFIGAGPGAADLITIRGARALDRAQVVLADALIDPALREFAPNAQWLDVGKRGFAKATDQTRINTLLVQHAQQGLVVARLKGGDPSVFGRLEEELQALSSAGIAWEIIPGVTAALAAAAASSRPLTRRGVGRSVSFTTAMTRELSLSPERLGETQVFYMAGRQLGELACHLLAQGWHQNTGVSVVSRAGWPDQCATEHTLGDLKAACVLHAGRPTVVTIGVGAMAVAQLANSRHTQPDSSPSHSAVQP